MKGILCAGKDNYVICVGQDGDGVTMVLEGSTRKGSSFGITFANNKFNS